MKKNVIFFLLACLFLISCSADSTSPNIIDGPSDTGTVTDIDGNIYQTVKLGDQWWMAQNLKVTHYQNGDSIPYITNDTTWSALVNGAYCNYNNDVNNAATYGHLYNGYVLDDSRNVAPAGWHVATHDEWQTLVDNLGGDDVAGGRLKATGTIEDDDGLWYGPNQGATNESAFSALPGGIRFTNGTFERMGHFGTFWTADAWIYILGFNDLDAFNGDSGDDKQGGASIRCVKD